MTSKVERNVRRHSLVEEISDERRSGDGIWAYLKPGFKRDQFDDVHSVHEDTWTEVRKGLRGVVVCRCDDCLALLQNEAEIQKILSSPIALSRDELLVLLIEECSEVIQAATKCLRFGYHRDQPSYGVNSAVLAKEIGDLIGVVDALPLDGIIIAEYRRAKVAKATRIKNMIANESAPQPLESYK